MSKEPVAEKPRANLRMHLEPYEAQMLKDMLEGQGIPAFVHGLNMRSQDIPLPSTQLWVYAEDEERARTVLDDVERSKTTTGPPQTCPTCGEESPANFGECWSCGGDLFSS